MFIISMVWFGLLSACEPRANFRKDIQPILETHCVRCHGPSMASKGLRLHRKERAMMAIVPGKPEESRAYMAAKSRVMPPTPRKLTPTELGLFRRWILKGAKWPKDLELHDKP